MDAPDRAGHFDVSAEDSTRAHRRWWDAEASAYLEEHGSFLGDAELVWGPEGWTESELNLLGDLKDAQVLEIGAGAAQGGRWCFTQTAQVVSTDLSAGMLRTAQELNERTHLPLPLLQCDAGVLPFADAAFDVVFSSYGAIPFIADTAALMRELARVLRPGGRLVFTTTHPIRWAFPDVPNKAGLTVAHSYFDTTPYAEAAGSQVTYVEHHRTIEGRVSDVVGAGLVLHALRELPWKPQNHQTWGGWSPLRGQLIPGTLAVVAHKPTGPLSD